MRRDCRLGIEARFLLCQSKGLVYLLGRDRKGATDHGRSCYARMRVTPLRWILAGLAALGLSGCLESAGADGARNRSAGLLAGGETRELPPPLARAELARGAVVVAGPEGYCVDPVTLGRGAARNFAVLASCQILSGGRRGPWVEPAMMTVTVGPAGASALPAPQTLAAETGAALIGGETRDGFVVAHLGDGGAEVLDGGDARYWRGAFLQGGRMVGLALYAPSGSPLAGDEGVRLLRAIRSRIAAQSPG